jgi:hypothetical protein
VNELSEPEVSKAEGLRQNLAQSFNAEELYSLCADLEINYEDVQGATLDARIRELVAYCNRRGLVVRLIAHCRRLRPHIEW